MKNLKSGKTSIWKPYYYREAKYYSTQSLLLELIGATETQVFSHFRLKVAKKKFQLIKTSIAARKIKGGKSCSYELKFVKASFSSMRNP